MKVLIALTAINLAVSATTLTIVIVGARRVKTQVKDSRAKANVALKAMRASLDKIEL